MADELIRLDTTIIGIDSLINKASTAEEAKALYVARSVIYSQQRYSTDVQPIDDDNGHIIYIGRKAYLAENTIMEFMKKMDIIRNSLAYIENYFDTYAETIRQINACGGRCTDITEIKYFIDRIKENSGYD